MKLSHEVLDELRVKPAHAAHLASRDTKVLRADWLEDSKKHPGHKAMKAAEKDLASFVHELSDAQELLWADGTHALLIVLQALDAAGKDGTIKHVMSGVNPQGCRVESFKQPSSEELHHDYLWRASKVLPELGAISIFNRSYYEDVLVVRVHPEFLDKTHEGPDSGLLWKNRLEDINTYEQHLTRNDTRVVKIFLHVSKDTQMRRFLQRLDDPSKNWKFSSADLIERGYWDDYQRVYEETLSATSTSWAPWYVVPADHKYSLRALVSGIIVHAIDELNLTAPTVSSSDKKKLTKAREQLLNEH
jgi:PPK2 family polyphosphate:nucleotide phosphotransferase